MACVLLVAGLAVNFATTRAAVRRAHAPARGPRAASACSRSCRSSLLVALAASPGGHRRPGLRRLERSSPTRRRRRRPTRPTGCAATSSVRARYWRESWTIYENSPNVGAGRGRLRDRAHALPRRHPDRPPRPRLRGPDARRPRPRRRRALAAARRVLWIARRDDGDRAATARPRPAVRPGAHRAADDGDRGRRVRRPLADRLDVVRARQRRASRCCARPGLRAAGRCARAREPPPARGAFSWRRPPRRSRSARSPCSASGS